MPGPEHAQGLGPQVAGQGVPTHHLRLIHRPEGRVAACTRGGAAPQRPHRRQPSLAARVRVHREKHEPSLVRCLTLSS